MQRLRDEGFTEDFELSDDAVVHVDSGTRHRPQDVEIVATHRNEGDSNPDDESILFAVRTPDGLAGVLVSSFGPEAPHPEALRLLGQGG